jgi:arylsulfatase A-like enzyme
VTSGEHRIPRGKNRHYAPSSHVPLVVRGPGFPAQRCGVLTGIHDIAPTVLRLTGADPVDTGGVLLDGRSLQDVLAAPDVRPGVLLEITDRRGRYVLRGVVTRDDWKYVELDGGFVEMYDLTADPFELRNLADDPQHAARRAELADLTDELGAPELQPGSTTPTP